MIKHVAVSGTGRWQALAGSYLWAGLLALAVGGCDRSVRIEHPIADSVTVDMTAAIAVRAQGPVPEAATRFVERLAGRDSVGAVGVLEGEREYEFGDVTDVAFITDTSFGVLDRMTAEIPVFTVSGRHLYTVGGKGEGPGELGFPVALVRPGPDVLWVIDQGRAIHQFGIRGGVLEFADRVTVPGFAQDACATDGQVVVHAPSAMPGAGRGEVLFVVNAEGARESAFGVPYRYDERVTARTMKRGTIACLPGGRVAFAPDAQNRLDLYTVPDGARIWYATFEGMRFPRPVEIARPGEQSTVTTDVRDLDAFNFFIGLAAPPGGPLLVQLGTRQGAGVRDGVDRLEIHTYVVDPASGEGALVSNDLPRIMAVHDDLMVFLRRDVFPRVEIYRLGAP